MIKKTTLALMAISIGLSVPHLAQAENETTGNNNDLATTATSSEFEKPTYPASDSTSNGTLNNTTNSNEAQPIQSIGTGSQETKMVEQTKTNPTYSNDTAASNTMSNTGDPAINNTTPTVNTTSNSNKDKNKTVTNITEKIKELSRSTSKKNSTTDTNNNNK